LFAVLLNASAFCAEPADSESLSTQEEAAIHAAVAKIAESVVQIRTIGGLEEVDRTRLADGPTTGLILSADGWIVSSSFNFIQQPASILVTLANGEQMPAELVARDHSRQLALLKLEGASGLAVPELVPANEFRVGQWAIAVGRTFRADRPNISVGIISAVNRMFGRVVQTDADVSTANYGGPLIDIRGRVLGVIVPIAPQTASEVAGAEWYDSGIGFAAPLAEIGPALERMKQGEDQYEGKLGIGFEGTKPHESPAEIAAVMPNSPARRAGLQKGDRIVEIDGQSIDTQSDLRFAVGPRYGGEEIRVTTRRGDKESTTELILTGELEPFRHAFLGMLPLREDGNALANKAATTESPGRKSAASDEDDAGDEDAEASDPEDSDSEIAEGGRKEESGSGILVRMVFDGSPAAEADIRSGDRVLRIDGTAIESIADALNAMNSVWPEADVAITIERGEERLDLSLRASQLSKVIPAELPPAYDSSAGSADTDAEQPAADIRNLKLAEFSETCRI
jgi:serine protease Do